MMVKHLPKQHADNAAILIGAVIELLVILKVPQKLQLTVEELAAVVGLGLIIAGTIRGMWRARRDSRAEASS